MTEEKADKARAEAAKAAAAKAAQAAQAVQAAKAAQEQADKLAQQAAAAKAAKDKAAKDKAAKDKVKPVAVVQQPVAVVQQPNQPGLVANPRVTMKAEADRTKQIVNDGYLNAGDLLDRKTAYTLYGNDPQGKNLVGDWRKNKISCNETKQYTGSQDFAVRAVAGADQHFKNLKCTAMHSQPASQQHAVESQVRPWACLIKDDTRAKQPINTSKQPINAEEDEVRMILERGFSSVHVLIVTKRNTLTL